MSRAAPVDLRLRGHEAVPATIRMLARMQCRCASNHAVRRRGPGAGGARRCDSARARAHTRFSFDAARRARPARAPRHQRPPCCLPKPKLRLQLLLGTEPDHGGTSGAATGVGRARFPAFRCGAQEPIGSATPNACLPIRALSRYSAAVGEGPGRINGEGLHEVDEAD